MNTVAFPASLAQVLWLSWEELGADAHWTYHENAREAFSFTWVWQKLETWRKHYGLLTADGLALLWGRAFGGYWLRLHPAAEHLHQPNFRMLPPAERRAHALEQLAQAVHDASGRRCALHGEPDGSMVWSMDALQQDAFFWAGALGALTAWASGDKVYPIRFALSAEQPALIVAPEPL